MARSTYVYILMSEGKVIAAFTVKRELLNSFGYEGMQGRTAFRVRDGKPDTLVDITEEIREEVDKNTRWE